MAAIIKSEDQDSWGGGTGGSSQKAVQVDALGGIKCQVATHICQGIFKCNQLRSSLIDGCQRFEVKNEDRRIIWDAE
ncbi:hypothetical protein QCA50_014261 [Cerrena zonata]|uniref:Uncharacterized protein n=1 Tax=Cerrena zonata TaxID=2478898 RepID=A0AAW0FP52_9APHY